VIANIVAVPAGQGEVSVANATPEYESFLNEKFSAERINGDCCPLIIRDLGERAKAHLDKADKYEEKAEQHKKSLALVLAQAKELCDEDGFDAFRAKFCPAVGRTRAYELLAIATNKKSIEEIRAANRERVARHRAKSSVTVTDANKTDVSKSTDSAAPGISNEDPSIAQRRAQHAALFDPAAGTVNRDTAAAETNNYTTGPATPNSGAGMVDLWPDATLEQRRELFQVITIDELVAVLPNQLRQGLEDRVVRLRGLQRSAKLTKLLRTAVKSRSTATHITELVNHFNRFLTENDLDLEKVHVSVSK
jgi:hypothetical protein